MESGTAETATILPRLPQSLAVQLFAGATPHHLKAGEALFMVGDPGDGCYRLEQGLLKVVITSPRGDTRILAVLGPGSIAGELALIDGRPRSASVFAIRDCELRFVGRNAFEECMAQHPEIYRYLVNVLAGRLRETNEAVAAANFLTPSRGRPSKRTASRRPMNISMSASLPLCGVADMSMKCRARLPTSYPSL